MTKKEMKGYSLTLSLKGKRYKGRTVSRSYCGGPGRHNVAAAWAASEWRHGRVVAARKVPTVVLTQRQPPVRSGLVSECVEAVPVQSKSRWSRPHSLSST